MKPFLLRAVPVAAAATMLIVLWDEGSAGAAVVFTLILLVPYVPMFFLDSRDALTQWVALAAGVAGIVLTIDMDRSINASDSSTAALGWLALAMVLYFLATLVAVVGFARRGRSPERAS